jgi:ABC-type Fe3+/spermidine/putrescine transport system ATPase subunit
VLEIKNISFSYDREILHDVSISLKKGQFLGIVGIIGGYLTPNFGEVHFNGKLMKRPIEMLIPGYEDVAFVHQDFGLDLYHTVFENIKQKILHLPLGLQDKLIWQMIDLLDLHILTNQKAVNLSGGEQQRLSIARALASESDLILLDEPFVHLDAPMRRRLLNYLQKLKEIRNTSFIIVTHNGDEILGLCDEAIYMKKGRIKRKTSPSNFYDKPKSIEEAEFFGPINSILLNDKRKLFRPNQYNLTQNENEDKLKLSHLSSNRQGALFNNYFRTNRGEEILLFNLEPMNDINCIYV